MSRPNTDQENDGFLLGALLLIPAETLTKRVFEGFAAAGFPELRPAHIPVFQLLKPNGDRITDLAARARTTKQAMGYLVAHLEACGYVERVPDPSDGRAQLVRRTQRGWEVNRAARRLVKEVQDDWAVQMGAARMQQLLLLLQDLVRLIGVDQASSIASPSARPKA